MNVETKFINIHLLESQQRLSTHPIIVTLLGKTATVIDLQPSNAAEPIAMTVSGKTMDVWPVQAMHDTDPRGSLSPGVPLTQQHANHTKHNKAHTSEHAVENCI